MLASELIRRNLPTLQQPANAAATFFLFVFFGLKGQSSSGPQPLQNEMKQMQSYVGRETPHQDYLLYCLQRNFTPKPACWKM